MQGTGSPGLSLPVQER